MFYADGGVLLGGGAVGVAGLAGVPGTLRHTFLTLDAAESEAGSGVSVALTVVEADAALPSSASSVSSHS